MKDIDLFTSKYKTTYYNSNGVETSSTTSRGIDPIKTAFIGGIGVAILWVVSFVLPLIILIPLIIYITYPMRKLRGTNSDYESEILLSYGYLKLKELKNVVSLKTILVILLFICATFGIYILSIESGAELFKKTNGLIEAQLRNSSWLLLFYLFIPALFNKERRIVKKLIGDKKINCLDRLSFFNYMAIIVISFLITYFGINKIIYFIIQDSYIVDWDVIFTPIIDVSNIPYKLDIFLEQHKTMSDLWYMIIGINYSETFFTVIVFLILSNLKDKYFTKNKEIESFVKDRSVAKKDTDISKVNTSKLKLYFTSYLISIILSFIAIFIILLTKDNLKAYSEIIDSPTEFFGIHLIFALIISIIVFPIRLFNQKRKLKKEAIQ